MRRGWKGVILHLSLVTFVAVVADRGLELSLHYRLCQHDQARMRASRGSTRFKTN